MQNARGCCQMRLKETLVFVKWILMVCSNYATVVLFYSDLCFNQGCKIGIEGARHIASMLSTHPVIKFLDLTGIVL